MVALTAGAFEDNKLQSEFRMYRDDVNPDMLYVDAAR